MSSIIYPLTAPSTCPMSVIMQQESVVGRVQSPFTLQEQMLRWPGNRWNMQVRLPPMKRAEAEEWIVFALELQGMYGTFLYGDPAAPTPRGVGTGTPLVAGLGQSGDTLATDGWTPNTPGILLKGDWFQVGTGLSSRLFKARADVDSDAGGNAVIPIYPEIFGSIQDNAPITVINPRGLFRMADNSPASWSVSAGLTYGFSFSAVGVVVDT